MFAYLAVACRQCVIEDVVIVAVGALRAINRPDFYDILYYGCLVRAPSSEAINIGPSQQTPVIKKHLNVIIY